MTNQQPHLQSHHRQSSPVVILGLVVIILLLTTACGDNGSQTVAPTPTLTTNTLSTAPTVFSSATTPTSIPIPTSVMATPSQPSPTVASTTTILPTIDPNTNSNPSPFATAVTTASQQNGRTTSFALEKAALLGNDASYVYDVVWSPDGKLIATTALDKTVKLWRSQDGTLLKTLNSTTYGVIGAIAWSPDGKYLATGGRDGTLELWEGTTGQRLDKYENAHPNPIERLAWSPDGQVLVTGSADEKMGQRIAMLWTINTTAVANNGGGVVATAKLKPVTSIGNSGRVSYLLWFTDGKTLVTGSNYAPNSLGKVGDIRLWDNKGQQITTIKTDANLSSLSLSADNRLLAGSLDQSNLIKLWNTDAGTLWATLSGHTGTVQAVRWQPIVLSEPGNSSVGSVSSNNSATISGPSGTSMLLASSSDDKTIRLWKADGTLFTTLSHGQLAGVITWSPDGKILASSSNPAPGVNLNVKLWAVGAILPSPSSSAGTGVGGEIKPVATLEGTGFDQMWSPDGTMLAVQLKNSRVQLWKIRVIQS